VREGRLSRAEAAWIAGRWLRDNALDVFQIEKRRAAQVKGQPAALKL